MPILQLMKFWAASGKADNCKTSLPNFYSQLHCKVITDMTKPTKLTEVCVNTHVRMGSTVFFPSQGNLAARNRCSWCCQQYSVLQDLFSPLENLNLKSPLQENCMSFHYWCCFQGMEGAARGLRGHPSMDNLTLPIAPQNGLSWKGP